MSNILNRGCPIVTDICEYVEILKNKIKSNMSFRTSREIKREIYIIMDYLIDNKVPAEDLKKLSDFLKKGKDAI